MNNSTSIARVADTHQTKDEHFISDYQGNSKEALTKLTADRFNTVCLHRKHCCLILWAITKDVYQDTDKNFDPKVVLKDRIKKIMMIAH